MSDLAPVAFTPSLEGEILPPLRQQPVVVSSNPFTAQVREIALPEGFTLEELLWACELPEAVHNSVHILIGDQEIHRRYWHCVRPRPGRPVYVRVQPRGGGGGGGRKNILASVLMLAVTVVAAVAAPMILGAIAPGLAAAGGLGASLATSLIGAGITMLGSMLISALIPPPKPPGMEFPGQRAMIQSVRNRMTPFGAIPRIFGQRRVYPVLASRPYTEAVGDNRYLRVMLVVGYGPLAISEIKIGETPIGSFSNIQYHVNNGWEAGHANFAGGAGATDPKWTYHPNTVTEEEFSSLLDHAGTSTNAPGPWVTRTTPVGVDEIVVDVTAPAGLVDYNPDGSKDPLEIIVDVQYRAAGDPLLPWLNVTWDGNDEADGTETNGQITMKDDSPEAIIKGGRWEVATGQYEVRLRRRTASYQALGEGSNNAEEVRWTAMRTIVHERPIQQLAGICTLALRMKATDQFNGFPDTINCVASAYLPTQAADGTWTWAQPSNPAWAYADVLRRRGTKRMLPDSRIDMARIRTWATACDAAPSNDPTGDMWDFNAILDGGSIYDALKRIAAAGRAQYTIRDGTHSVVQDEAQATPVQHITPRNSWGYSGNKAFLDRPHALRVQFVNKAMGYRSEERIVYDDGYTSSNATLFEVLELPDCTNEKQAYREGRYFLAAGKLRPEEHSVSMDIENLRCTVGDRVQFAHDAISVGIASGRIAAVTVNGSNQITSFTLDGTATRLAGTSYRLRVRTEAGDSLLYTMATAVTEESDTFQLATPIANASTEAKVGDLYTFGEAGSETAPMVVKAISPGQDLTAKVTLVPYDAAIFTADTAAIPAFDANINNSSSIEELRPLAPTIFINSGEYATRVEADGSVTEGMVIRIKEAAATIRQSEGFRVQYRRVGARTWKDVPGSPSPDTKNVFRVICKKGQVFQVRALTRGIRGINSAWVVAPNHTVGGSTRIPPVPASFSGLAMFQANFLFWNEPESFLGFSHTEIYAVNSATQPAAPVDATVPTHKSAGQSWTHGALQNGSKWYYWARSVARNGAKSAWVAINAAGNLTYLITNLITTSGLTPGSITTETIATNALTVPRRGWWPKKRVMTRGASPVEIGRLSIMREPGFSLEATVTCTVSGEGHGWVRLYLYRGVIQVATWTFASGPNGWNANRTFTRGFSADANGTFTYHLKAHAADALMDYHNYPESRDMAVANVFFSLQQFKR